MRTILVVMALATFAAAAATAQTSNRVAAPSYAGTWGFQSEDYGNDEYGVSMSGVAVITQGEGNRYVIRLLAQELISQRESGHTHLLVAHENCAGDASGGQFSVTCQMAEPLENYQPDAFILQPGDNPDQLVGALTSASTGQTTFNRMH